MFCSHKARGGWTTSQLVGGLMTRHTQRGFERKCISHTRDPWGVKVRHKQVQAGLSEAEKVSWDFIMVGVGTGGKCLTAGWGFGKPKFPVGTCPDV